MPGLLVRLAVKQSIEYLLDGWAEREHHVRVFHDYLLHFRIAPHYFDPISLVPSKENEKGENVEIKGIRGANQRHLRSRAPLE